MSKDDFTNELMAYQAMFKMVDHLFAPAGNIPSAATQRQPEQRLPLPLGMPQTGFTVAPEDIYVIDGDTVVVQLPEGHSVNDEARIRIRLRSIECPELPLPGPSDDILKGILGKSSRDEPGLVAKGRLKSIIENCQVHVVPCASDRYGRVLADLYAGEPFSDFKPAQSRSVETEMMRLCAATQRIGEPLPSAQPVILKEEEAWPDWY